MRVRAALLIVPLLFALLAVPVAGSALSPAVASDGAPDSAAPALQSDGASERSAPALQSDGANQTDVRQVLRINLTDDGDARWSVTTRIRGLDTETDRQSFRDLAAEYEAGETDAGYSAATFEPFAANASEATGREMEIVNASRSSRLRNETGYLSLSFTWTNFARVDGERILLGDVFQTPTGPWLSELEAGQRLVISAPPGYAYESFHFGPSPDGGVQSGTATWTGPATFGPGELEATYVATGGSGPTPPTELPLEMIALAGAGLLAVVGGLALGGYVLGGRDDAVAEIVAAIPGVGDDGSALGSGGDDDSPAGRLTPPDEADAEAATDDADPDAAAAASDGDASTAAGGAAAAGVASNSGAEGDSDDEAESGDDEINPELLSDEERVERLLRKNGGRMKQATIVKETGWSNAKVSQLLSSMDDDERVNKLRIGRENLISLPDEDVADVE